MSLKVNSQDPLYFVAIVPPEPVAAVVQGLKEEMARDFASKAALRSPPHITLHMPFCWPDRKFEKLSGVLAELAQSYAPIPIELKNFGAFPPRVIFIGVEQNEILEIVQQNLLIKFKRDLHLFNGDYKQRGFHPHMTIAFRDLRPAKFKLAWQVFQERKLDLEFTSEGITLLKHNDKYWEVHKVYRFRD